MHVDLPKQKRHWIPWPHKKSLPESHKGTSFMFVYINIRIYVVMFIYIKNTYSKNINLHAAHLTGRLQSCGTKSCPLDSGCGGPRGSGCGGIRDSGSG